MSQVLCILVGAVLAGYLNRVGGLSKEDAHVKFMFKWLPEWMVNTKTRDLGVSLVVTLLIYMLYPEVSVGYHLVHFVLLFGALTTYWSEVLQPYDHVDIVEWFLTGLCYGLAGVFYMTSISPLYVIGRAIVLALLVAFLSDLIDNADLEEFTRGVLVTGSLLLWLI